MSSLVAFVIPFVAFVSEYCLMIFLRVSKTRVSSSTFSADFKIFSNKGLRCLDRADLLGEEFGDVFSLRPL